MNRLQYITEEVLPVAINKRDGEMFLSCVRDSKSTGEDQFASNVVFVKVNIKQGEELVERALVVKLQTSNSITREWFNSDHHFYNEVYVYDKVLPFLNYQKNNKRHFAEFYYGLGTLGKYPERDIVVLEDLRPFGFTLTEDKTFLDYDHLVMALKELGQFHALSYAAKNSKPDEFFKVVQGLRETNWRKGEEWYLDRWMSVERAVRPLMQKNKHVEVLQRFLKDTKNICAFMTRLVTPEEPLAVICHGDFNRNNILFKYDGAKPLDVKFFDVATARYASPAIDLSFFLFMNSSRDMRATHWDDLLQAYYLGLSTAVAGSRVPSFNEISTDFIKKAAYGFVLCSFYLPIMDSGEQFDIDVIAAMTVKQRGEFLVSVGGQKGTDLICDIVEFLLDIKCLE